MHLFHWLNHFFRFWIGHFLRLGELSTNFQSWLPTGAGLAWDCRSWSAAESSLKLTVGLGVCFTMHWDSLLPKNVNSPEAWAGLVATAFSSEIYFQRKLLKKHSNVTKLYNFEIRKEFSRGKMSRNIIKKFISCFWQKSSIQNGFQMSKTTK